MLLLLSDPPQCLVWKMESCYMCSRPATSREHVPPKCFFPEKKDLPSTLDYRVNLITVPACDQHNLSKSKDDEYLFLVIVSHWQNNLAAQRHFSKKVRRAMQRRPNLRGVYLREYLPVWLGSVPTGAPIADRERLDRSLEWIARALHFHRYGTNDWSADIWIHSPAFVPVSRISLQRWRAQQNALEVLSSHYLAHEGWLGDNPDIFRYRIYADPQHGRMFVRMVFYDGFPVTAYSVPPPV
jgi:hypothetical protein